MAALAQCDAFAFIYDQAGDPAPDVLVVLKRVLDASGNPILLGPKTTTTDSAGAFHFTLPELATAFISARASALWNCPDGRAFTVPPGPSGELVPDFSLPASTLVEPPLVYVDDVLSIPMASETQDGYLSAADFVRFEAGGADVGITQIDTGTGLTGGPIIDTGTIGLAPISGVAGFWSNPTSITVNAYGQIIAIAGVADTTAPIISAISGTLITSSGATIIWTTDDFSDSQVEYGTTTSYDSTTTLSTTPVTSHSVPITGTTASTLYHYRVKSRNTAGLLTTSGDNTFTTTAVVDTTPPVISAITATAITDTGATITWTTDEASDSQVEYGLTTSYGTSTTLDAAMVTSHSVPITGTTASTLYHYRVKSRNAASLLQTSGDNTFTTTAAPVAADLLTNLVSMWKLDESGATARADSHGSNALTVNDFISGPGNIAGVTGKIVNAAHFVAGGNSSMTSAGTNLQTGDVDYSMALWVQLDDDAADVYVLSKTQELNTLDEYIINYTVSSHQFAFTVAGGPSHTYTSIFAADMSAVAIGTWYFIIAWHDMTNGNINIQVGTGSTLGAVNSAVRSEPLNSGTAFFQLGMYGVGGGAPSGLLHGLVDELAFWKPKVLTPEDRAALWNSGAGLPFSSWT